jgi:hypothetical protein
VPNCATYRQYLDCVVNHLDIDRLAWAAHNEPQNLVYDLNGDHLVSFSVSQSGTITSDSDMLIRDVLNTEYGDTNLDGEIFIDDLGESCDEPPRCIGS